MSTKDMKGKSEGQGIQFETDLIEVPSSGEGTQPKN